jgi:hypothetical protein
MESMRLLRFLEQLPPATIILCSLILLAAVGVIDYVTGPIIASGIFYLIPISVVAWVVGRRAGLIVAVVAAALWLTIELMERPDLSRWICCWNAGTRLVFFTIVTVLMADLKNSRVRLQKVLSVYAVALHRFCDSSGVLCGIIDVTQEEMVIVAVNRTMADLHEMTTEAVEGRDADELGLTEEATTIWLDQCRAAKQTGEPQQFDYSLADQEGPRLMHVTVTHLGTLSLGRERFAFIENNVTRRTAATA